MKSANWISATGRSPCRAMPMATPTMEDSASGVSITRCSPNSSRKPAVTRNTPPRAPTSSPMTSTRSSDFISSNRVSWIVLTRFFSVISRSLLFGEDVPHDSLGVGIRSVPGLLDRRVHLRLQLGPELLRAVVVEEPRLLEVLPEQEYGIVLTGL